MAPKITVQNSGKIYEVNWPFVPNEGNSIRVGEDEFIVVKVTWHLPTFASSPEIVVEIQQNPKVTADSLKFA